MLRSLLPADSLSAAYIQGATWCYQQDQQKNQVKLMNICAAISKLGEKNLALWSAMYTVNWRKANQKKREYISTSCGRKKIKNSEHTVLFSEWKFTIWVKIKAEEKNTKTATHHNSRFGEGRRQSYTCTMCEVIVSLSTFCNAGFPRSKMSCLRLEFRQSASPSVYKFDKAQMSKLLGK